MNELLQLTEDSGIERGAMKRALWVTMLACFAFGVRQSSRPSARPSRRNSDALGNEPAGRDCCPPHV